MRRQEDKNKRFFANALAAIAFFLIFSWQVYFIFTNNWTPDVSLPLQLCGISKILGAIILIKFNQRIFEFILLLGMAGALQAILTPQFEIPVTTYSTIEYYMSHTSILLIPLYLFYVQDRRVKKFAWLYTFILGITILCAVGIINYFVQGNYIFLCAPPLAPNPLLVGSWPYYLIGFLVFGFINISLFYLIFEKWGKWLDARKRSTEET